VSDTKLANRTDRETRIRERAYHLWEDDGRPHGRESEFWERAKELIGMEDHATAARLPNPMTRPEPIPGVTVEEAAIQENYGEIPDGGDRRETPKPRSKARRSRKATA